MSSVKKCGGCCSAVGCCMRRYTNLLSEVKMFRFPVDPVRRAAWCDAVKRDNWTPNKNSLICNNHFITGKPSRDRNHPDYVPSVFNFPKAAKDGEKPLKHNERNVKRVRLDLLKDASTAVDEPEDESEQKFLNQKMKGLKEEKWKTMNKKLSGRRIVDICHFIQQIQDVSDHGQASCSFKDMVFINEQRQGLNSNLKFRCQRCSLTKTIWTDVDAGEHTTINAAAVRVGGGYPRLKAFMDAFSVPCLTHCSYIKRRRKMLRKKEGIENKQVADQKGSPLVVDDTWKHAENVQSVSGRSDNGPGVVLGSVPILVNKLASNSLLRPVTKSELIPITSIIPDLDSSEPGLFSQMEQDVGHPTDSLRDIKKEPVDPDEYSQDILSSTIRQELSDSSHQKVSLFHPPVLIKEEPVQVEEES